jgi:hypothetical protein
MKPVMLTNHENILAESENGQWSRDVAVISLPLISGFAPPKI